VQPPLEDLADVFGVVVDVEMPLDEHGNASGGPQFVGPAVVFGYLQQERFELLQVRVVQARRRPGLLDGSQPAGRARHSPPAMDGSHVDPQHACDGGRRFAPLNGFNGPCATTFEFLRGYVWSWHTSLYAAAILTGSVAHAGLTGYPESSRPNQAIFWSLFGYLNFGWGVSLLGFSRRTIM
jgi:hypothetical protein